MKQKPKELKSTFEFQAPAPEQENVVSAEEVLPRKFNFRLIVRNPFNQYQKGNLIFKDEDIQSVLDGGFVRNCCKTPY